MTENVGSSGVCVCVQITLTWGSVTVVNDTYLYKIYTYIQIFHTSDTAELRGHRFCISCKYQYNNSPRILI